MSSSTAIQKFAAGILLVGLTIPLLQFASAQTVIDREWFESQADTTIETKRYYNPGDAQAQVILENEFEDGTFEFSHLSTDSLILDVVNPSYAMPADVPGADAAEFQSADYVTVITDYDNGGNALETSYVYYRIDDDALVQLGWYSVLPGQSDLKIVFEPELKPSPIPVEYDADAEPWVTEADQVIYLGSNEVGRTRYRITMEVEGYGTLILPTGSQDALRVRTEIGVIGETPSTSVAFRSASNEEARLALNHEGDVDYVTYTHRVGVTTSAEPPVAGLPDGYRLDQNYPNPFNPTTRIGFEVPQSQHVRITVFDALGRHVETLVDGFIPAGVHEATFRNDDLPSGVYMYHLEAGPATATGRMVLLK